MILTLLAQPTTNPTGPEFGKASPLGLVIILLLLAGTVLLVRSMNKHIKRLPAEFSPEHPEPDQEADDGTEHGAVQSDPTASDAAETSRKPDTSKPEASTKPDTPGIP